MSDRAIAATLALASAILYVLSGIAKPTDFHYYAPLARAFLEGRWWLEVDPAHLNELLECGAGRWCVAYVPLPAFLVLPFVLVFDERVAQTLASAIAGGLAAAPAYLALRRLDTPPRVAVLTTVFGMAGTTLWFTASEGKAWYFAHAAAVLFATAALLAALDRRPAWLVGALIGAAALSRLPVGLAAFGLAWLVHRRRGEPLWRVLALGALGLAPFAFLELGYNVLRWGVPWEEGYQRLAEMEPYYEHGLLSPWYLPRHLYVIFMAAPEFVDGTLAFLRPTWLGTSVLLVSPAFAFAIGALRHLARVEFAALALAAALPLVPDLLHGNVGWTQWGYRFSLDAQPFLLPLVALGAAWRADRGWGERHWAFVPLVVWSVMANLYGLVAIRFFDHVTMVFPPS